MADQKQGGIAWTDATFNPGVHGVWGADGTRVFSEDGWEARFDAWEKKAAKAGKPMRSFVNSMWDPGEGPDVDGKEGRDGPRAEYLPVLLKLVQIARRCPHLRLQMLTKRPWNLVAWWRKREWYMMDDATGKTVEWPANLWIGVSVENQEEVARVDDLMRIPAAVRFLSVEPMLGPVLIPLVHLPSSLPVPLPSKRWARERKGWLGNGISWVIAGCESGRGARPMDLDWVRELRDQCVAFDVPFFFKQAMEGGEVVSLPTLDGKVWDQFPAEMTP